MKKHKFQPGDVVVTNFNGYQHWSLVSDSKCTDGEYMLISATKRNGTVREEAFKEVTQGCFTYKADGFNTSSANLFAVSRARAFIGRWKYSVLTGNCEHFVNFIFYGEAKSKQVNNGIAGAMIVGGLVTFTSKNPRIGQLLLLSVLASCLFVYSSRANESTSAFPAPT